MVGRLVRIAGFVAMAAILATQVKGSSTAPRAPRPPRPPRRDRPHPPFPRRGPGPAPLPVSTERPLKGGAAAELAFDD